jgi:hypothetical protein
MLKQKSQGASDQKHEYALEELELEQLSTSRSIATVSPEQPAKLVRGPKHPKTGLYVIALSGALGAIAPLIALALQGVHILRPGVGRISIVISLLVWPASILMIEAQSTDNPVGPILLRSYVGNIAIYLLFGCLLSLGLMRPCSILYLTIVLIIYLALVSVAGFCAWLVV